MLSHFGVPPPAYEKAPTITVGASFLSGTCGDTPATWHISAGLLILCGVLTPYGDTALDAYIGRMGICSIAGLYSRQRLLAGHVLP